ncbi:MAG: MG2 domain-containing protein, partial [Acidobacteriota bacterium]
MIQRYRLLIQRHRLRRLSTGILLLAVAFFASGAACGQVSRSTPQHAAASSAGTTPENGEAMAQDSRWEEVERLIGEAKFDAASDIAGQILADARQAGNEEEHTRALIKLVQLRIGLHGYETAVRFLRQEPWPEAPLQRTVLNLFYARSLVTYLQSYSWEINQRERMDTSEEIDLKAWTRDQIVEEAQRAYLAVWQDREAWGDSSLGALAEYLEQNDYPARIRGTLRDAVTYLWVELLIDTSLWRPEQSSSLYRLYLDDLLAQAPEAVALDDPAVHPLRKLATILADLEVWHRKRRQPEAAFAAHLERSTRLFNNFSEADDRRAIRQDLERALDDLGRRYEWWSMGMASLAEQIRSGGGEDALVEAHRVASEGAEAHPESAGGRRCRHLIAQIEAPSYQLSAMASDNPNRRSVLIEHRNLPDLHLRAYVLDLDRRIENADDRNLLPSYRDVPPILARQKPVAEWRVDLPGTPDYRSHRTYVTPPMTAPGLYLVVASARRDFAAAFNQQTAVNVIIGDLVILNRSSQNRSSQDRGSHPRGNGGTVEATVRSGATGHPLAEVEVDLYRNDYRQGHTLVERRTTGSDGIARFASEVFSRGNHFLVARRGDEIALTQNVRPPHRRRADPARTASLIYTDRSVYRPGQTIHWKAVAYRSEGQRTQFDILPETDLTLTLMDANGQQVATAEAKTNAFGSASGEIEIPSGRLLGGWHLQCSLPGSTSIKVEEYKRPTFEVTVTDPDSALRLNQPATLTGEVRYYFGLPVVNGDVTWRVTREPVYPRWGWYRWSPQPQQTETLATGDAELDAEGQFRVTFTPEADERQSKQVTYRYRLSVDVTDEGGETRSASRSFRLGFVAVEASIDSADEFFRQGREAELTIRRTDLDGVARAGRGAWRLVALEQPEEALLPAEQPIAQAPTHDGDNGERYTTPGDHLRPRWETSYLPSQVLSGWDDGSTVTNGTLDHGDDGQAVVRLSDLAPGAYRLRY